MLDSPKVEIYVVGHKASEPIPSHGVFIPIQVSQGESFCSVRDNTGDNIADKNGSFCELTALYWIWKNTSGQDYVGLFHYRRHLSFSGHRQKEDKWRNVAYKTVSRSYLKKNRLADDAVIACIQNYDLILPQKFPVYKARCGQNVLDHYANSPGHFLADYLMAVESVKQLYPAYAPYCDTVSKAEAAHLCNIFIMRRSIFDAYCAWLFDTLFNLEPKIETARRSATEKRVFGYLSERLFNIFLAKLYADRPELKVKILQQTLLTEPNNSLLQAAYSGLKQRAKRLIAGRI